MTEPNDNLVFKFLGSNEEILIKDKVDKIFLKDEGELEENT